MSDIYYYGNQPMLKYKSGNTPCAVPIDKLAADRIEQLQAQVEELTSCLSEAVDLTEDVIAGDYKPDSFTTQPWRAALKQEQDETIDDLVERIKPR